MTTKKEIKPLDEPILGRLSKYISENLGIYFPENRWNDLANNFHLASLKFGFTDDESCINWLFSNPTDKTISETLASCLTIGETYFFRDKNIFDRLERNVLPELIFSRGKTGKRIRIWSAGCSTGEEPYSIAILLQKMIPDIRSWDISIRATDINPKFLRKATKGVYGKWSFRKTQDWVIKGYFTRTKNGDYQIRSSIKRMVNFSYHNLTEDPYPSLINSTSALDIVFCRNVLMYFHPDKAVRVMSRIHRALLNGGWLVVGGSEGMLVNMSFFEMVNFSDAIMYRKKLLKNNLAKESKTQISYVPPTALTAIKIKKDIPGLMKDRTTRTAEAFVTKNKQRTEATENETKKEIPYEEAVDFYNQGNYNEMERILTGILSNDNNNHQAMYLLAKAYSNQGKFNQASEWCTKLLASDRMNPASHYLLALILREQGQWEEAIHFLENSIYLDPDFVLAHFTLGNLSLRKGNARNADKYFRNALSILSTCKDEKIFPGSDGLSAGRLTKIIKSIMDKEPVA